MNYIEVLSAAHRAIEPALYLEIGVRHGHSLAAARGRCYGIDPAFQITVELDASVRLFRATSDEVFARPDLDTVFERKVDLAFIDGMHLFEYVLRDFANVETVAHRNGVIFLDDIFPRSAVEAQRKRATRDWTGDVWKMLPCLAELRPDLLLVPIDTQPTGLLMVANLRPGDATLWRSYETMVARYTADDLAEPPAGILCRRGALDPRHLLASGFLSAVAAGDGAMTPRAMFLSLFPDHVLPGEPGSGPHAWVRADA